MQEEHVVCCQMLNFCKWSLCEMSKIITVDGPKIEASQCWRAYQAEVDAGNQYLQHNYMH